MMAKYKKEKRTFKDFLGLKKERSPREENNVCEPDQLNERITIGVGALSALICSIPQKNFI